MLTNIRYTFGFTNSCVDGFVNIAETGDICLGMVDKRDYTTHDLFRGRFEHGRCTLDLYYFVSLYLQKYIPALLLDVHNTLKWMYQYDEVSHRLNLIENQES